MTANIGIRLRKGDVWAIIRPTETEEFQITVESMRGRITEGPEYEAALAHALGWVSRLRHQLFAMLGRKPTAEELVDD